MTDETAKPLDAAMRAEANKASRDGTQYILVESAVAVAQAALAEVEDAHTYERDRANRLVNERDEARHALAAAQRELADARKAATEANDRHHEVMLKLEREVAELSETLTAREQTNGELRALGDNAVLALNIEKANRQAAEARVAALEGVIREHLDDPGECAFDDIFRAALAGLPLEEKPKCSLCKDTGIYETSWGKQPCPHPSPLPLGKGEGE